MFGRLSCRSLRKLYVTCMELHAERSMFHVGGSGAG